MRKLISIGLVALLAFALVTCDGNIQDENVIVGYTNVEYSDDGKNITIYLDGTEVPVTKAARSLTADLAKKSHDYYEVIFYFDNGTVKEVARAAWEIGEAAAITNVYRTALGVDYELTGETVLDVDVGYAVLFAGRKADKTLLGVGRLTDADGGPTAADVTTVTTATTKVTFTVASLVAGAPAFVTASNSFPAALTPLSRGSSFWTGEAIGNDIVNKPPADPLAYVTDADTADAGNTVMITRPAIVAGMSYRFPAFGLVNKIANLIPANTFGADTSVRFKTPAAYTIYSNHLTTASNFMTDQFDAIYKPAIRVFAQTGATANPAFAENKLPRFPLAGNRYYEFRAPWAIKTTTVMHPDFLTAAAAGAELPNPILFDIETHAENDGFISLTFTVPVYAISDFTPPGVENPITWYIRPGFGTYYYDLDDGTGGPGGSLLLAVGNVNYDSIDIIVKQIP